MQAAEIIRRAVAEVSSLREHAQQDPGFRAALRAVKQLQARRFAGTYADLLAEGTYAPAARFFLKELYSDNDYTERDLQFARIAGAIERLFPADVAATAAALAQLHSLTEQLDYAMARAWLADPQESAEASRYTRAWRTVGRRSDREAQLRVVLEVGAELARLTRRPGLRMMLKMMRGPAAAGGLSALQRFLESGFETFARLTKEKAGTDVFLRTIKQRESALMSLLFDGDVVTCETELATTLGQAR